MFYMYDFRFEHVPEKAYALIEDDGEAALKWLDQQKTNLSHQERQSTLLAICVSAIVQKDPPLFEQCIERGLDVNLKFQTSELLESREDEDWYRYMLIDCASEYWSYHEKYVPYLLERGAKLTKKSMEHFNMFSDGRVLSQMMDISGFKDFPLYKVENHHVLINLLKGAWDGFHTAEDLGKWLWNYGYYFIEDVKESDLTTLLEGLIEQGVDLHSNWQPDLILTGDMHQQGKTTYPDPGALIYHCLHTLRANDHASSHWNFVRALVKKGVAMPEFLPEPAYDEAYDIERVEIQALFEQLNLQHHTPSVSSPTKGLRL